MTLIFRPASQAAAAAKPFAKRLAALLRGRKGVRSQVIDGFLLHATGDGKNVIVRAMEAPAILGVMVGGGTTVSIYQPNSIALYDTMLDAMEQLTLTTSDLCYPADDFEPIALQPKRSGTQVGIVTVENSSVVYGEWDTASYQSRSGRIYRGFATPNALLSVAVMYVHPELNNPWREPVIGISRLAIGAGIPQSTLYRAATKMTDADYFEIDVYGLGIEESNAAKVIGALEWGKQDGAVLVDFGVAHLIRYSVTTDDQPGEPEGSGVPVGHIDWRHELEFASNLSGPFSAAAGDKDGDKACVLFCEITSDAANWRTYESRMVKVSASGDIANLVLNTYTYDTSGEEEGIGEYHSNIYVQSVLTAPVLDANGEIEQPAQMRFVAINLNRDFAPGDNPTSKFRLFIFDEAGGKIEVALPGKYPLNEMLGYYSAVSGGFVEGVSRQRTPICQYAPGFAAVLVGPTLDYDPSYSTQLNLHMAVVNVTTGEVVGVSPVLTTHSIMDGLTLCAVEQGHVVDGVITRHAKLLLSQVKITGIFRPLFKPLFPTDVFVVHGLDGATKVATCTHPASAYYLGTMLKPAKIGLSSGIRGLLRPPSV